MLIVLHTSYLISSQSDIILCIAKYKFWIKYSDIIINQKNMIVYEVCTLLRLI
jgi:hypothetical protein